MAKIHECFKNEIKDYNIRDGQLYDRFPEKFKLWMQFIEIIESAGKSRADFSIIIISISLHDRTSLF